MTRPEISREHLSETLREAREKKGWTLEQLARELWLRGCNTSQNKLWRLENQPPARVDTELLLWLEKVLQVELFRTDGQTHVLIEDVIAILDAFHAGDTPSEPENDGLRRIHRCVRQLTEKPRPVPSNTLAGIEPTALLNE